jgi:hypothetical protein
VINSIFFVVIRILSSLFFCFFFSLVFPFAFFLWLSPFCFFGVLFSRSSFEVFLLLLLVLLVEFFKFSVWF